MKYKLTQIQLSGNKLINDAIALLDLLNETNKTSIKMTFSKANCGRANQRLQKFTIPVHAITKGESYLFYYVIHEYSHCMLSRHTGHNNQFKQTELILLNKFTNIDSMDYARAYPKTIYANGEIVYKRKGG